MNIYDKFESEFSSPGSCPEKVFVPYRICPLGAHIDHQLGKVTGFALDKGVTFLFLPSNSPEVSIFSLNFDGKVHFDLNNPLERSKSWGDYAKAAAWSLKNSGYNVQNGFYGVICGELSAGGLSSSAAVIISYIKAFCLVNGLNPSRREMILIAQSAENEFIGLNCGTLDQSCEILCKKDSLLLLDTRDGSYRNIPCPKNMPEFEIAIFFSGLTRSLVSSKYNLRTQELREACQALKKYAGIASDSDVMRNIPVEVYRKFGNLLPPEQKKRCEHYYSEFERVEKGILAFENGKLDEFGRCIFESGQSSIENYEAGSPELICLYNIMKDTDGIYGGRFSGAGFKGCCMAIIDPEHKNLIKKNVTERYCRAFPQLADKFSVHFCKTADGCK